MSPTQGCASGTQCLCPAVHSEYQVRSNTAFLSPRSAIHRIKAPSPADLELLRVGNDLLQHAHHAAGTASLLVLAEARRRRRARRLLLGTRLREGLLRVHGLQDVQGLRQKLLGLALVRDGRLEVRVLLLAVLTRALQLRLHLRNLGPGTVSISNTSLYDPYVECAMEFSNHASTR